MLAAVFGFALFAAAGMFALPRLRGFPRILTMIGTSLFGLAAVTQLTVLLVWWLSGSRREQMLASTVVSALLVTAFYVRSKRGLR